MSTFDQTGDRAVDPELSSLPGEATITDPRHRRSILISVCIALMAVIAGVSGLNVAQPPLALDLDASHAQVLWIINIYAITLAALLLPLGAVGDRWGRKPVLLAGLAVFLIANAVSAIAPTTEIMLGARFFAGVGAAMIMPVTLSVITSAFPPEERAKGIGIWTAVAGGGGILGMFLSAILVDMLNWRLLFVLPIALSVVAGIMALGSVPNSRETSRHAFDFGGALLSLFAIVALIFFLHEGPEAGWTAPAPLTTLFVAILGILAFIWWELKHPAPLLDMRFFARRNLTSGSVSLLTWFGVQAGVFIVLYPFFQAVLGWSGLLATAGLMPMALLMMVSSALAPRLMAAIGPRMTMALGMLFGGLGLSLLALLVSVDGGFLSVLPGMVVMGLGMGLSMTPSTEGITSALPRDKQGVASALNDVTRELGTALGVALLGATFTAGYGSAILSRLEGVPQATAELASKGIATALDAARQAEPYSESLAQAAKEAFVAAWQQSMWAGVVAMALLLAYVLVRGPVRLESTADQ